MLRVRLPRVAECGLILSILTARTCLNIHDLPARAPMPPRRIDNDRFPHVTVRTREEWRAWLECHHTQEESIWLVRFKKASGEPALSWDEAVDEALCFGWIDSAVRKLDDARTLLLMSPRRAGSNWSVYNKAKVERLIRDGRMTPAGMAKIEAAKHDGTWSFLDDVMAVPDDLAAALRRARISVEAFEQAAPPSLRRGWLENLKMAKRAETRTKRIEAIVAEVIKRRAAKAKRPG